MKCIVLAFLISISSFSLFGQTFTTKRTVQTIIQQRGIYLNGGLRATADGKSRVTLKVDLPPNTKLWYYSFTTTPGESGIANLNLAIQLSAVILEASTVTQTLVQKINVPPGSASIDAYVFDQPNSDAFLQKVDNNGGRFYFSREGSIENTRQGVIEIDDIKQGTVYLGLKNPSTLDGVNVVIEVAAVVEEVQQLSVQQSEAVTYGDLAWKAFQRGDYDRCLQLSFKSLEFDNTLGYVHFNIGLAYLVKGFNNDALDYYTKAIALTHKSSVPKGTFEGAIQDLKNYMGLFPSQTDAQDILAILQGEARKY